MNPQVAADFPSPTSKAGLVLSHPFFAGMSSEERALIAMAIKSNSQQKVEFGPHEIIFREGEPANRFYLIESGSVMLETHEPADGTFPVQTLKAGDVIGFSWLFPPFTWCLQARALERTRVIALDGADLLVTAEENRMFGYELMKRVGRIAIQRLKAFEREYAKVSRQLETARQQLDSMRKVLPTS